MLNMINTKNSKTQNKKQMYAFQRFNNNFF